MVKPASDVSKSHRPKLMVREVTRARSGSLLTAMSARTISTRRYALLRGWRSKSRVSEPPSHWSVSLGRAGRSARAMKQIALNPLMFTGVAMVTLTAA